MVKRMTDTLLHDYLKYTNKLQPFSTQIHYDKYPEQKDDVGSMIQLSYRNRIFVENDDEEGKNIFIEDFIILRHDTDDCVEPKMIAISKNYKILLCIRTDQEAPVYIYPKQMYELLGLPVRPQYVASEFYPRIAYIMSAATSEPLSCVIIEYVSENESRYFTSDEVQCEINPDLIVKEYELDGKEIASIREKIINRTWEVDFYNGRINEDQEENEEDTD